MPKETRRARDERLPLMAAAGGLPAQDKLDPRAGTQALRARRLGMHPADVVEVASAFRRATPLWLAIALVPGGLGTFEGASVVSLYSQVMRLSKQQRKLCADGIRL